MIQLMENAKRSIYFKHKSLKIANGRLQDVRINNTTIMSNDKLYVKNLDSNRCMAALLVITASKRKRHDMNTWPLNQDNLETTK